MPVEETGGAAFLQFRATKVEGDHNTAESLFLSLLCVARQIFKYSLIYLKVQCTDEQINKLIRGNKGETRNIQSTISNRADLSNTTRTYNAGCERMQVDWKNVIPVNMQLLSQICGRSSDYLGKLLSEFEEISSEFFLENQTLFDTGWMDVYLIVMLVGGYQHFILLQGIAAFL